MVTNIAPSRHKRCFTPGNPGFEHRKDPGANIRDFLLRRGYILPRGKERAKNARAAIAVPFTVRES